MRKVKEVWRLRFELGLGQRQIARSCGMGLSTVHDYLEGAAVAGIGWALPEGPSEEELERKLFGNQMVAVRMVRPRPQPDWKAVSWPHELQGQIAMLLQLLVNRQTHPVGRYSWFCERYQQWGRRLDELLRQEHMFADWPGRRFPFMRHDGQALVGFPFT